MKRFIASVIIFAGCSSTAGGVRSPTTLRQVSAAHLEEALADPTLGVVLGTSNAPALARPLRREGAVTLPAPGSAGMVTLEVTLRAPGEPWLLDDLPLAVALARQAAAGLVGVDPTRWRWKATFPDVVVEPPLWTSAQLAAGFCIAIAGLPLSSPRAVVLGVIDPTGALLVAPKAEDALARGALRGQPVGIPAGDVRGEAGVREAGGTPRQLASLSEAVELISGQALPGPAPADEPMRALSAAEQASLEAALTVARTSIVPSWQEVLLLDSAPRVPAKVRALAAEAARAAALAEQLAQDGELPAALVMQGRAAAHAVATVATRKILGLVQLGDAEQALELSEELHAVTGEAQRRAQALMERGETQAGIDALAFALEAWVRSPDLGAALLALRREIKEVDGRDPSELGAQETAARLATLAAALALLAETLRQDIALAELLVSISPPAASPVRVVALPPAAASYPRWREAARVDTPGVNMGFLAFAVAQSCGDDVPRAAALCRWVATRAAEAAAWRALYADPGAEPGASAFRTESADRGSLARVTSASVRGAHAVSGAAPSAARFWLAAGSALAAVGEHALARDAYRRAHASAELAQRNARARASARAGEPAAPAR